MQQSKDYLLRDIEKLSQMLIGLIDKITGINSNTTSDVLEVIDTALQNELELSLKKISAMEANAFKNHSSAFHETHLEHLAKLLYQLVLKLDAYDLKQDFDAPKLAEKAILLMDVLDEKSKTFSMQRLEMKADLEVKLSKK